MPHQISVLNPLNVSKRVLWVCLIVAFFVPGVAHGQIRDPLEPLNRKLDIFNALVGLAMTPVLFTWNEGVPEPIKQGVRNVHRNSGRPLVAINSVLQGDMENAVTAVSAFGVDTVYGFGGVFRVAKGLGMEDRKESFGQTLAVWGVGEGFYLVLPFYGPSNLRDTVGLVIEFAAPVNSSFYGSDIPPDSGLALFAITSIDDVASNKDFIANIYASSLDPYSTIKSFYEQDLLQRVYNGDPPVEEVNDPFSDFDAETVE